MVPTFAPRRALSIMVPEVMLYSPATIKDPDRVPEATTPLVPSVNVHVQLSAIAGTKPITKARTNIHAILFISTPFQAYLSRTLTQRSAKTRPGPRLAYTRVLVKCSRAAIGQLGCQETRDARTRPQIIESRIF